MRIIADLVSPTSGSVTVNGISPEAARLKRAYGYVFQAPALYAWHNVVRNVMLPLEIIGMSAEERGERAKKYLAIVGLTGFERKFPWQLSGGMQQRVSIARALSFDPAILLMDEPFGALDAMTRESMNVELQRIWMERRKTVLFITHSTAEAVFLADRVIVMTPRPGRIGDEFAVDLPRPRRLDVMNTERFGAYVRRVRAALNPGGGGLD